MVGNIILYLSIVSAAFQLKAPLPPYLPPVEQSRLKLVCLVRASWAIFLTASTLTGRRDQGSGHGTIRGGQGLQATSLLFLGHVDERRYSRT
jgi:hypothetical protein